MCLHFLEADFSTALRITVWCLLPIYGALLGLSFPFLSKAPNLPAKAGISEGGAMVEVRHNQLSFFFGIIIAMASYRGYEGSFCQGQLSLSQPNIKFLFLTLAGLGTSLVASIPISSRSPQAGTLGFSPWHLGQTMAVLWGLLPLTTQLTTSLLILELIGVTLVWALSNVNSYSTCKDQRSWGSTPGLVYALVVFVWASGISALSLLIGLGLTGLVGANNFSTCGLLVTTPNSFVSLGEALFALVLVFKFLMGGGQFLLITWYRFLTPSGLVFYLFFYYPAHLVVGTTFFLGLFIAQISVILSVMVFILIVSAFCLLPHLGAQNSPALTLAGSSFIGLSFLAIAIFNLGALS